MSWLAAKWFAIQSNWIVNRRRQGPNLRQCVGPPPPERTGAPANRRLGQRNLEIGVLRDSDADLRLVWLIHRLRIRYVTETIAARFVAAVVVAPKLSHEEPVSAVQR
jgi:hypothetical protein